MQVQFVPISKNKKTGAIAQSNTESKSCPPACPFRKKGCYYGAGYYTRLNWQKLDKGERGSDWNSLCDNVRNLEPHAVWRHNVGGDFPHYNGVIDFPKTTQLVAANDDRDGFTYTHHDMSVPGNRMAVKYCNDNGFTVNLSANVLRHADELSDLNIGPVVVSLPSDFSDNVFYTPAGRKGIICPAISRDDVTCKQCKLCARSDRKVIIGFPAHGPQAKAVDEILAGIESEYDAKAPQRDPKTGHWVKGNVQHKHLTRDSQGRFEAPDI